MIEKILICTFSLATFSSCQLLPLNLSNTMTPKEEMMKRILTEAKQGEAKQFYEDGTHQMGSIYNEGLHPDNYFFLKEELISIGLDKYEENFENYSF